MPAALMPSVPDHVPARLRPRHRDRPEFHGEVAVAHGFLAVVVGVLVEDGGGVAAPEEVDVGVDCAGEGLGEPVEGDGVEDGFGGGRGVGPGLEFLADPGVCQWCDGGM